MTAYPTRWRYRRLIASAGVLGLLGVALAPTAEAQSAGKGFLFQEPRWMFAIHGGFDRANARGELFDFVTDDLTLDRGDFSAPRYSIDLGYSITRNIDLSFSGGYTSSKASSESRKYIGTDELPITQTTRFTRVPLMASLKLYLLPRGETIGSLAWVPSRFAPFVGAGGGAMMYRFQQEGEFVDAESPALDVFRDRLVSTGWVPAGQALGGFDFALSPRLGLTTEAKYTFAKKHTDFSDDEDFQDYRIDLSGLSVTMGFHVRF